MNISVIVPVFNRANLIKRAVKSVLEQTYSPAQIIVVDDGSQDKPGLSLKEIRDQRLKIVSQSHQGVSAARNLGIKSARGEWIAFLDSDDWWLSQKLEKQVYFHKKYPDYLISQTDEQWIRNGKKVNPRKYHLKSGGDIFEPSLDRCLISPSAVLLHRKVLDRVGLFDKNLPACEDYDLWLKVTSLYPAGLIKEKLVLKTGGHPDQLSQKYWGMDRFRVMALEKLLNNQPLSYGQKKAVIKKLIEKLKILRNGARKRGKYKESQKYEHLIKKYLKSHPDA